MTGIKITDDGQAEIKLKIDEKYTPLRAGHARRDPAVLPVGHRQPLHRPRLSAATAANEIEDGGKIDTDRTNTAVDLDQLFNTLDPDTRKALQGFFQGQARQFSGSGEQANEAFQYLNPALATSSRLFNELTKDQPVLERFLVDSSKLVTALAERRDDLSGPDRQPQRRPRARWATRRLALAESVERLPPFMRRANTTFVNLRAALERRRSAGRRLQARGRRCSGPSSPDARAFAADAEPTVRGPARGGPAPGRRNDLIEFIKAVPPLADIAVETKQRNGTEPRRALSRRP